MLNAQQRLAMEYADGPLMVLAGAGSGKTSVITRKIAWLVRHKKLPAEKIAAITFTNKAAREMRERVGRLLDSETANALMICTFHALGLRFLHIEHERAGLKRNFSVLDADDTGAIIKELAPKGVKSDVLWQIKSFLSRAKQAGWTPEEAARAARGPKEVEAATIYDLYQKRLSAYNAVDFDDLIRLPLAVLEGDTAVQAEWRERLRYLLVDEYQDTNEGQYRLLKCLAGEKGALTCVGDDDQSIYAWRGANPENIRRLSEDYPALRVVKLEQNYRCSRRILRAANALIAHNSHLHEKKLWSDLDDGPRIRVLECKNSEHEAEKVAGVISYLAQKHKARWNEFAILYRGNHQARVLEKALRLAQISYHLSGAQSLLDRVEVKDVLGYLRLIANPDDDAAFLRIANVPKREVGATTLEKLGQLAQSRHLSLLQAARSDHVLGQLPARSSSVLAGFVDMVDDLVAQSRHLSAADLAKYVIQRTGYTQYLAASTPQQTLRDRRLANLQELCEWFDAMGKKEAVGDLTAQLALLGHADQDDGGNTVRLMTLHSAKGLEFRFVFIVGCQEGTLPHEGAMEEGHTDEERRLMYVGITRAKELLILSWARHVRRYGEILTYQPSRFLSELPEDDIHWQGKDKEADAHIAKETAQAHLEKIQAMLS